LGIEVTINRKTTVKNKSKVNTAYIEIRKIPPMPPVTQNDEGNDSKTAGDILSTE
jgi:hypothetical protein